MYFITGLSKCELDSDGWPDFGAMRTFGYEKTFEEAEEIVKLNVCNIFEYTYNYMVIEKFLNGPYPICEEEHWYKWDDIKKSFCEIEKPEYAIHFCNFGMG